MSDPRSPDERPLSDLAAGVLREAEAPAPAPDAGERDAHLALLVATLRDERARAARRRWTGAALAIAAVIVVAIGARAVLRGDSSVTPPQRVAAGYGVRFEGAPDEVVRASAASKPEPGTLHAGDRVVSKSAPSIVAVATGTKLTLDRGAELSVVEEGATQIFALGEGSVRADVAKLHEGERFLVRTADTEVEVRGTSFRVERVDAAPACRPGLHTRVIVTEGVVVVRHAGLEDRVKAGEQWPLPCATGETHRAGETQPPAPPASSPSIVLIVPPAAAAAASSGSKLAASNDLFSKAQLARKGGDPRAAVALYDKLLTEYPSSPIVESATVERMRTLDQIDRARSVAAARDYLARFPNGFARGEAEAIVALGP